MAYNMRRWSVIAPAQAGSGHTTTCLSAADIMSVLFFYSMRYNPKNYESPDNDRFILSKGHASPLLYAAWSRKMLRYQSDKTSLDPRRYDEIEKMQRMMPFLVETRVSKIWRVAKSGAYLDKKKQMTNEERWLCEALIKLISSWRKNVIE